MDYSPVRPKSDVGDGGMDVQVPDYSIFRVPNSAKIYEETGHIMKSLTAEKIQERLRNLGDWYQRMKQVAMKENQILAKESSAAVTQSDVEHTAWRCDIFRGLLDVEKRVLARLERVFAMKQSSADTAFKAEYRALMRAADENIWDAAEDAIRHFIRMCRDMSVLRSTNDETIFSHIRHSTGIDDIELVTFEDLVLGYEDQGGGDRSWYDQPQMKTRSNRGLHDRQVLRTESSCLREKVCGLVGLAEELDKRKSQNRNISTRERVSRSERRDHSMSEIYLWAGRQDFELVSDWEFDNSNPAHICGPVVTPSQQEIIAAGDVLMSLLNGGVSQQINPNNSIFPEPQTVEDLIESDSSTTSTSTSTAATITTAATSSSIYSVSLDDVFYSQKASTKRKADSLGYEHEDKVEKSKEKKNKYNEESHLITAAKDIKGREILSEAILGNYGKKCDDPNKPYPRPGAPSEKPLDQKFTTKTHFTGLTPGSDKFRARIQKRKYDDVESAQNKQGSVEFNDETIKPIRKESSVKDIVNDAVNGEKNTREQNFTSNQSKVPLTPGYKFVSDPILKKLQAKAATIPREHRLADSIIKEAPTASNSLPSHKKQQERLPASKRSFTRKMNMQGADSMEGDKPLPGKLKFLRAKRQFDREGECESITQLRPADPVIRIKQEPEPTKSKARSRKSRRAARAGKQGPTVLSTQSHTQVDSTPFFIQETQSATPIAKIPPPMPLLSTRHNSEHAQRSVSLSSKIDNGSKWSQPSSAANGDCPTVAIATRIPSQESGNLQTPLPLHNDQPYVSAKYPALTASISFSQGYPAAAQASVGEVSSCYTNTPASPLILPKQNSNSPGSPIVPAFNYQSYSPIAPFVPSTDTLTALATTDSNTNAPVSGQQQMYYIGGGRWSYAPF